MDSSSMILKSPLNNNKKNTMNKNQIKKIPTIEGNQVILGSIRRRKQKRMVGDKRKNDDKMKERVEEVPTGHSLTMKTQFIMLH